MKYIILLLVCIYNINTQAQSFVPFPFSNSEWRYRRYDFPCPFTYCGTDYYKFSGDTVIQGLLYNKLTQRLFHDTSFYYLCGIRQDSTTGDLYMNSPIRCGQVDTLLYSFNYNVQDTIKICDQILGDPYTLINSIDSVLVLGVWRKRINLNNMTSSSNIEGIGSTAHLIGPWAGWIGGYTELECFLLNGQAVYPTTTCDFNNINNLSNQLPFSIINGSEVIEVSFNRDINQPVEISLLNSIGEIMIKNIQAYVLNGFAYNFDVSSIKSGIYFLCIRVGNERKSVTKLSIIK